MNINDDMDLMSKMVPQDLLFEMVFEAMNKYRNDKSEENKKYFMYVNMMLIKNEILSIIPNEEIEKQKKYFEFGKRILG